MMNQTGVGQAAQFGAHEVMEIHEVLTDTIDGINLFQLYRPHVTDSQLAQILDRQLTFMMNEYNTMVNQLNSQGFSQATPYQAQTIQGTPKYGLRQPAPESPNASITQLNDRDVASGVMGCAKASATLRMHAALECADATLRKMMIQGAENAAEQAYEVWSYMNQKGYYQIPTMKQNTTQTMLNTYQQGSTDQTWQSVQ